MKGFFKDFKDFIAKGNVMDLAVGVIIGGAFGKIVTSLVEDIIMPLISLITGGVDFSSLKWVIKPDELDAAGEVIKQGATLNYGMFITHIIDFLIIALCIFLMLRAIMKVKNKISKPVEEEPEEEKETAEDILAEIRDLMKKDD